jgi:tripartite-type tricarboxylate transporter receptor subunit TctC
MKRLLAGACIFVAATASTLAQDLASIWRGKTISIVSGTSAGGGFDAYARLLARHIGKHIPGRPQAVVSNMPGAGSNIMAAYVANVAPKDGTVIGAPLSTMPLAPILEDLAALRYDPGRLVWLGSANEDVNTCIVRRDSPVKSFADAMKIEALMGGSSETGQTGYLPVLLANVLGAKFKPVFGYPGSREVMLAMEKGEVDGQCGMSWTSLRTQYASLFDNDRVTILLQERMESFPELGKRGVPAAGEVATTDEQRKILGTIYAQSVFGRPYFISGDVPKERAEILRAAFMETMRDREFLVEAEKLQFDISPMTGEAVQKMLADILSAPEDLKTKIRAAIRVRR